MYISIHTHYTYIQIYRREGENRIMTLLSGELKGKTGSRKGRAGKGMIIPASRDGGGVGGGGGLSLSGTVFDMTDKAVLPLLPETFSSLEWGDLLFRKGLPRVRLSCLL